MDIRYKLYPYPVLSAATDDYKDSQFVFKVQQQLGIREVILKIHVELENESLWGLVQTDKAEFVVHIECPYTSYREALRFQDTEYVWKIPEKNLNGKVSICTFLVAKVNIKNYLNENWNEVYKDLAFDLERGSILAIGGQYDLHIVKEMQSLAKVPSIFTICRSAADNEEEMKIDIADHKIAITLSSEVFQNYKLLAAMPHFLPVLHSMLILPALLYVFETLLREGVEDFETRRWFRVLEKTLQKDGISLNQDTLNNIPSYELAQKLLDLPIQKALSAMASEDDVEEE
jgi:hypothetical protein